MAHLRQFLCTLSAMSCTRLWERVSARRCAGEWLDLMRASPGSSVIDVARELLAASKKQVLRINTMEFQSRKKGGWYRINLSGAVAAELDL